MNNTHQIIIHWDKGQPFAERMSAKILSIDGYTEIDPQCPTGGPDGTKDIICIKGHLKFIAGCYFPHGQKPLKEIGEKFGSDYQGVAKHKASGFVFITNQKITPTERTELATQFPASEIYHGERVCNLLDSPQGYGIRLEYLGIELNKAEQISFLSSHVDLKEQLRKINETLESIRQVTRNIASHLDGRDELDYYPSVLPIAGISLSSRISFEDLFGLHFACMQQELNHMPGLQSAFRNIQVWIGPAAGGIETATFIPPEPNEVPRLMRDLLNWWRTEYECICYGDERSKISAIALFHARFLEIHPFLDGNGRVARAIASIQCKDLISRNLLFDSITPEARPLYYKSIIEAHKGAPERLADILMSLVK